MTLSGIVCSFAGTVRSCIGNFCSFIGIVCSFIGIVYSFIFSLQFKAIGDWSFTSSSIVCSGIVCSFIVSLRFNDIGNCGINARFRSIAGLDDVLLFDSPVKLSALLKERR